MMEGKMSEVKLKCTLTDNELVDKSKELVSKLCETGGHSWCLRVPVDLNNDPDIIFTELGNRVLSLRAQLSEAQGEIADLKNELNRCDCGACDWCNGTTYYHMKRKLYQKDKDCQKAEAANADLQRKLNVAVRLEADSDATFDWNVLGKIDDLERENDELRERLKPVEYQNHEFCKDVECTALEYNSCNAYVCHKTAKHFHRWLDQNGYTISKAIRAACEGK
jgi:hypothetical protein